jgi:predicted molibdopterin-dependent oxidoreductase YjgC
MRIDATGDDVRTVRSLSLELLLSDHRADCEAPCSLVCPQGLDVERLLLFHDRDKPEEARRILVRAFALPAIACDTCKAPCEKACRRGTVDKPVAIRAIVRELAAASPADTLQPGEETPAGADKKAYLSRLGRFRSDEKAYLQENTPSPSRCLHCACAGRKDCKLRLYATAEGIKRPRYEASSALPAMKKIHVGGNMWFEQAKCIRCGLCVYNSENGFTFSGRGFAMQVTLPEENKPNISKTLASLCPTGAIYLS